MREEMRRGNMYVNLENKIRSLTNYRPTGKNREEVARLNATRRAANVAKEAPPLNEDPR
jgi:hypothetical protein